MIAILTMLWIAATVAFFALVLWSSIGPRVKEWL